MTTLGFKREDIKDTFHEVLDYTVEEWSDSHVLLQMVVKPEHRNLGGSVHGGVLSSLVDIAGFMGGSWTPNGHHKPQHQLHRRHQCRCDHRRRQADTRDQKHALFESLDSREGHRQAADHRSMHLQAPTPGHEGKPGGGVLALLRE